MLAVVMSGSFIDPLKRLHNYYYVIARSASDVAICCIINML